MVETVATVHHGKPVAAPRSQPCTQHPMEECTRHSAHVADKYIEREGCCALWDAMAPCKVRIGGWGGLRFRRTRGDGGYGAFAV